jgi:membrane-bound lytic murein transglycosylase D
VRQVIHVVSSGDTLSGLAARYGTSVSAIQTTNGIRNPRRLQLGAELSIPLTEGAYAPMSARAEIDPDSGLPTHTVRRGENPYVIARANGIPLSSLMAWNGLRKGTIIYPGMKLVLASGGAAPASKPVQLAQPTNSAEHVVRRGDNPDSIAKRYGVPLDDLLRWNSLGRRSVIYPGQRLRLLALDGDAVADARVDSDGSRGENRTLLYVVKRGDTLYDIGRAHSVTVGDLCRWNGISSRSLLHQGDRLTINLR